MTENNVLTLLRLGRWDQDRDLIAGLEAWPLYPLLLETYAGLREDALYQSEVHGRGHIHRTLLFAALIAWQEDLEEDVVRQFFLAAAYHDVGRSSDGFDLYHGARSALRLRELTGKEGEELLQLQAAVAAHARPDEDMEPILRAYAPADYPRTLQLTRLLKDADNLDRVRLGDLKLRFLRHRGARALEPFAWRLLDREKALTDPGDGPRTRE